MGVHLTSLIELGGSPAVGRVAGLEPATSAFFWQRSDQLSYTRSQTVEPNIGYPKRGVNHFEHSNLQRRDPVPASKSESNKSQ